MSTNPLTFTITNDAELGAAWQKLMGPGGFGQRSLWVIFLDDRKRTLPVIVPIDQLPDKPDPELLDNLASVMTEVMSNTRAESAALLLSRPGSDQISDSDRCWARALMEAVPPPMRTGSIHLATADRIRTIAPDDLPGAA